MTCGVILVAGATSSPGRLVVDALLKKGHSLRVLVRGEAEAAAFAAKGADVVRGDIRDPAIVAAACDGVTTVISMIGRHFAETAEGLWAVDAEGNEALIIAASAAGVGRFVLLSALFADRDYPPVLLAAKRHAENALIASKMAYAIVRPSTFMLGASSLVGAVGPSIERWGLAFVPATKSVSFVALIDVADALVAAALESDPALVVDLGGPEALTMDEGARRVAAVLGKRVWIVRIPRSIVSLMRWIEKNRFGVFELLMFTEMMCDHGYACDPSEARKLLGREPTSVDVELRQYYATTTQTPWAESNIGVLRNRTR
jgi:uncharacterized protein YbjT (DUF2867 family)